MTCREHWGKLEILGTGKVVLVLDASESAEPFAEEILRLAQSVLARLRGLASIKIYFLGNPNAYDPSKLTTHGGQWFEENRGRASLIGSILEQWNPEPGLKVVVVGSGHVFDIEDWEESPLADHFLLVSVNAPLQDSSGRLEEVLNASPEDVFRRVYNRVTRVAIAGSGFLPLQWNNPAYRLMSDETGFVLCAEESEEYGVALRFVAAELDDVHAEVTFSNDVADVVRLTAADPFPVEKKLLGPLPRNEVEIFSKARRHLSFECPRGKHEHKWHQTHCYLRNDLCPQLIYMSLPNGLEGFVILEESETGVHAYQYPYSVLWLGADRATVQHKSGANEYRLDPNTGRWTLSADGQIEPYFHIGGNAYVIVV